MGGPGSTRWPSDYQRRRWVEESWGVISLAGITQRLHSPKGFTVEYPKIGLRLDASKPVRGGRTLHRDFKAPGSIEDMRQGWISWPECSAFPVLIVKQTQPNYRGHWRMLCPECGSPVISLHIPEKHLKPACRECHDLAYQVAWLSGISAAQRREFQDELAGAAIRRATGAINLDRAARRRGEDLPRSTPKGADATAPK